MTVCTERDSFQVVCCLHRHDLLTYSLQDPDGDAADDDLLQTPALCSLGSPKATKSAPPVTNANLDYEHPEHADDDIIERPPSPKYDEKTIFFTTPAAYRQARRDRPSFSQQPSVARQRYLIMPGTQGSDGVAAGARPLGHGQQDPSSFAARSTPLVSAMKTPAVQQQSQASSAGPTPPGMPSTGPRKAVAFQTPETGGAAGPSSAKAAGRPSATPSCTARKRFVSQITPPSLPGGGPTPISQSGFKCTVAGKGQQLTLLSIEVHADSR